MNSKVETQEAVAISLGNFIREAGFLPAGIDGRLLKKLEETSSLGVLLPKKRFRFFGSRVFLGIITFHAETWKFKVYGRDNLNIATGLAQSISNNFGVEINVELVSEKKKYDTSSRIDAI